MIPFWIASGIIAKQATGGSNAAFSGTIPVTFAAAATVTGATGITATFSGTIPVTLTAASVVPIASTFAGTIPVTLAAAATVRVSAAFTATIDVTLAATATVVTAGTVNATFGATIPVSFAGASQVAIRSTFGGDIPVTFAATSSALNLAPITATFGGTIPVTFQATATTQAQPPATVGGGGGYAMSPARRLTPAEDRALERALFRMEDSLRKARTPRVRRKKLQQAEVAAQEAAEIIATLALPTVPFDLSEIREGIALILAGQASYPDWRMLLLDQARQAMLELEVLRALEEDEEALVLLMMMA